MNASNAAWPTPRLEQQFDRFNEGADLAGRNFERLLATQFDGYRDWVAALNGRSAPAERLEQHRYLIGWDDRAGVRDKQGPGR